jgi:hypothetical protein
MTGGVKTRNSNIVVVTAVVVDRDNLVLYVAGNRGRATSEALTTLEKLVPTLRFPGIDRCEALVDRPEPAGEELARLVASNRSTDDGKSKSRRDDKTDDDDDGGRRRRAGPQGRAQRAARARGSSTPIRWRGGRAWIACAAGRGGVVRAPGGHATLRLATPRTLSTRNTFPAGTEVAMSLTTK